MSMLFPFIIAITVAFGIVLFFLKKMLWSDTESAVNRLQTSYEEIKKQKSDLDQKLLQAEVEYKTKKEEAEKVASDILEKANLEATTVRDEAFKKAKQESEAIIDKAHKSVEKIRFDIRREVELHIIELCGGLIKDIFSARVLDQAHLVMVEDFIEELKSMDTAKIAAEFRTVDILTYKPLSEASRQKIKEIIEKKLKKEISIQEKADEQILCGMLVKFGGLALDGTLASRIRDGVIAEKQKLEEG
jgi:F0F1-type ATP synthase membrane subunit b/b'